MSRQLDDFITGYLEYTQNLESPVSYNLWCGISCIAAALQRKVYLRWGISSIYPNMYIVLIGPSGRCRKGEAMGAAADLVKSVGIRIVAESITREALIRDIKESLSSYNDPDTGAVKVHCSLTAFNEELSVFLGQGDVKFLADLTDWYNSKDFWTYRTKGSGTDEIQGICFNMLGATAPDWLISILPQEAIGGGFTSRIIFIVEENKRAIVAAPFIPDAKLKSALLSDLEKIHIMAGEMKMDDEALELYMNWYIKESEKPALKDSRFAGYNERRATHLRKLSMICAASKRNARVIVLKDVERAMTILESAEQRMEKVFKGLGRSRYSELTMLVFEYIVREKEVNRSQILRQFYLDVDDYTCDIVTKTLLAMRVIEIETLYANGDIRYKAVGGSI